MIEHFIHPDSVRLRVFELGDPARPSIVMVHGMRDVAMALAPIFESLCARFHIIVPDLRGHGASDWRATYDMGAMVADLDSVIETFAPSGATLWGHSLGGHIVTRFAALHPDRTDAVITVEGLGPPEREFNIDVDARRPQMPARPRPSRPLPSVEFASERLRANNPRLDPGQAATIARHITHRDATGALQWSFDPNVQQVFMDADLEQSKSFWRAIRCPTLIVMGDVAHEYWAKQGGAGSDGRFTAADLADRRDAFKHGRWITIDGAGHMVHYDKPAELLAETEKFLTGLHS